MDTDTTLISGVAMSFSKYDAQGQATDVVSMGQLGRLGGWSLAEDNAAIKKEDGDFQLTSA